MRELKLYLVLQTDYSTQQPIKPLWKHLLMPAIWDENLKLLYHSVRASLAQMSKAVDLLMLSVLRSEYNVFSSHVNSADILGGDICFVLQHLLAMGSVPVYFLVVTEDNGKSKTV